MVSDRVNYIVLSAAALSLLASCVGSPLGNTVQRSLEADPQLDSSAPADNRTNSTQNPSTRDTTQADANVSPTPVPSAANAEPPAATPRPTRAPEPGAPDFIGPLQAAQSAPSASENRPAEPSPSPVATSAAPLLADVPPDLQPYLQDLQALQLVALPNSTAAADVGETPPSPATSPFNQPITRREYARWLFNVNNTFYQNDPGQRVRAATLTDTPAFQDVPASDPDFAAIQGLANAGIVPSALTGSSTAVTFRPEAPLSREDLVLWKVPLDTRTTLPSTSPEAVSEVWGFQDTASIEPLALRAIAADFQLGDFSNVRRAFGYTTLFQPDKAVTRAEAAAVLWRFGQQTNGRSAETVLAETKLTETQRQ